MAIKSLWGPRDEGHYYDSKKGPSDQGAIDSDFADQFGKVDSSQVGLTEFLGQSDALCVEKDGRQVVLGHAAGLTKTGEEIDHMSRLLAGQAAAIVTTGSIRSTKWDASALPNVGFTDGEVDDEGNVVVSGTFTGQEGAVNHFAVHSPELNEEYLSELRVAQETLETRGQILIASLLATPFNGPDTSMEEYLDDWRLLIDKMAEAGVRVVELNFANPHVPASTAGACEGVQFRMPQMATKIAEVCRQQAPDWMKVGVEIRHVHTKEDPGQLDEATVGELVDGVAPHVDFITSTNTDPQTLNNQGGEAYFGADRPKAGISGAPLHAKALQLAEFLVKYRAEQGYEFKVLATGGAVSPETIQDFVDLNVDAVLAMTGLYRNPELFKDYVEA